MKQISIKGAVCALCSPRIHLRAGAQMCDDLLEQPLDLADALIHVRLSRDVAGLSGADLGSALGLHAVRNFGHQPPKHLRRQGIGLHFRLCKSILIAENVLHVPYIGKFARKAN